MSTGNLALKNLGIPVDKYYSSEIKPTAIKLVNFHFPDTIQLGDIRNWKDWDIDWSSIDLVLSGSPCKDLSVGGKREGIYGENSGLFWIFIDILNYVRKFNPKVKFLQENVGSASRKDIGIMSRAMGIYPVRINSSLVTAQLRDRYYWTNVKTKKTGIFGDVFTDISSPQDRQIALKDIIVDEFLQKDMINVLDLSKIVYVECGQVRVKTNTLKGYDIFTENDCLNLAFENSTTRRGRVTKGKAPCIMFSYEPLYILKTDKARELNKTELCRLQGFPDNYCDMLSIREASSILGDGWTLPIIEHILSYLK